MTGHGMMWRIIWIPLSIIIILLCVISSLHMHEGILLKLLNHTTDSQELDAAEMLEKIGDSMSMDTDKNPISRYHIYSQQITHKDIETFHARLPPLLTQYKNPCWLEWVSKDFHYRKKYISQMKSVERRQFASMQNLLKKRCQGEEPCWRMRCFPYFMSLGMQKAGTTTMYETLTKYHPQIVKMARKESQFWPRYRHGIMLGGAKTRMMTYADYLDSMDYQSEKIRTTHRGPVHGQIIGDYTPANAWLQYAWETWPGNENQKEPRVLLPHQLYHIYPHTKFIMNIRDPVTRYISNHYFIGKTANTLESSVITAIHRFDECMEEYALRNCVYSIKDELVRGMYHVFVKDWMDVFPRKQFYFMLFDEYAVNPAKVFMKISDFLELDPPPDKAVQQLRSQRSRNTTHKVTSTSVEMLQDFYRPWNLKLAAQLQDDRFLWHY